MINILQIGHEKKLPSIVNAASTEGHFYLTFSNFSSYFFLERLFSVFKTFFFLTFVTSMECYLFYVLIFF